MKTVTLMLLLGLSVGCCLFALASCGGTEPATPTAPATTDATTDLPACEHEWDDGRVTTAATCGKDGVKTFTCTKCGEIKTEAIAATGQHRFNDDTLYYAVEPTATSDGEYCKLCSVCGAEQRIKTNYARYQPKLEAAMNAVNGFTYSQFGGENHTKMSTTAYAAPTKTPTRGQHPRLLFTAADMDQIRAEWNDPANFSIVKAIIGGANSTEDGVRDPAPSGGNNYSQGVLNVAVRKALVYQMTGVRLYGYEAIKIAKNYLTTFEIKGGYGNPERPYGEAMFYMALVYDWCYDLLTDTDKTQFISGVQHKCCDGGKMEMGFPPSGQGAVSGHGCERQLLRDYLAFAVAIYDEEPTWYQFIGGRFFQEFVPVRNVYYASGYSPQGTSVYMSLRYCADLWSAWIMKSATGAVPYDAENMKQVMRSVYARIVDGKNLFFEEGDDSNRDLEKKVPETLNQFALPAQISAYLFGDATVAAWAKATNYAYTPDIFQFLTRVGTPEPASDRYAELDLILYNGGYLGQIIAHSGWTANDVTILMKVGNRTTANHDHGDSGAFQIYYKGLLAGDSGYYDSYGTSHHVNYHQGTIAHNSIVFTRAGSGTSFTTLQQRHLSETSNLTGWQSNLYTMGETTGYAYGYADDGKTPVYAYIAGNIAQAYDASVADEVTRRMLTVFDTGSDDAKAYFFVYDHIKMKSASDRPIFLLHTVEEPTVSGSTVTVTAGEGKLVLQNVLGADKIETIGGEGKNYYLNGSQLATRKGEDDGFWGRVEISSGTGKKVHEILNAAVVCDKTSTVTEQATAIETTQVSGCVLGNVAALFVKNATRASGSIKFTANGSGTLNVYVSGVAAGDWSVTTANGETKTVTATEEGGLLVFTAPAGVAVTLTKR